MTPQYLMSLYNQAYPYSQNVSGHVSFGEEINSLKSMLGTIMTKLNKLDSIETTVEQIRSESAEVKTEVETVKTQLRETKSKNKALEKKIIDLQSRSMRDNLVFYNIKEEEKYSDEEKVDTEAVLSKFIKENMKVTSTISLERVHRMGKANKTGTDGSIIPAPIVAKFTFFKKRESTYNNINSTNDLFDEFQNANLIDNCLDIESSAGKQDVTNDFSNNFSEPKTKTRKSERRGKRQNKSYLKNNKEKEHKNQEDLDLDKNDGEKFV